MQQSVTRLDVETRVVQHGLHVVGRDDIARLQPIDTTNAATSMSNPRVTTCGIVSIPSLVVPCSARTSASR